MINWDEAMDLQCMQSFIHNRTTIGRRRFAFFSSLADGRRYTTKRGRLFQEFDIFCSTKRECDFFPLISARTATPWKFILRILRLTLRDFHFWFASRKWHKKKLLKSISRRLSAFEYCALLKSHKFRRRSLSAQANYEQEEKKVRLWFSYVGVR